MAALIEMLFYKISIFLGFCGLTGTAGVHNADLGVANAAAGLIRTNIVCKVIVGGAQGSGTVVTHPRTASAGRYLETYAAVRTVGCSGWNSSSDGRRKSSSGGGRDSSGDSSSNGK